MNPFLKQMKSKIDKKSIVPADRKQLVIFTDNPRYSEEERDFARQLGTNRCDGSGCACWP